MSAPAQDTTYTTLTTALLLFLALILQSLALPRVAKWYGIDKEEFCVVMLAQPVCSILYSALGSFGLGCVQLVGLYRLPACSSPLSMCILLAFCSVFVWDVIAGSFARQRLLYDVPIQAAANSGETSYGGLGSYFPAFVIGSAKGELMQLPSCALVFTQYEHRNKKVNSCTCSRGHRFHCPGMSWWMLS